MRQNSTEAHSSISRIEHRIIQSPVDRWENSSEDDSDAVQSVSVNDWARRYKKR